ncbi:Curli production assembly/transport component CsgG [Candidatus Kryptobacter tengchongensis]|nr:Curli production assembly/transport component CsgG [Candidatus Kryptobacter tengchongensis]
MKIFKLFLSLILAISLLFSQDKKINVAVLKFDAKGFEPAQIDVLVSRFRVALNSTGKFNVLEREKIKEILMEQNLQQSEIAEGVGDNVQIGKILGVKEIITGDIGKVEELYTVNVRRISVETSEIVQTASADYEGKISGLLKVMEQLAYKLAENPSEKHVALKVEQEGKQEQEKKQKVEEVVEEETEEEDIFGDLYKEFNIAKDPFKDSDPPKIELYYPSVKNNGYLRVSNRDFELGGIVTDESGIISIKVNGEAADVKLGLAGMNFYKKIKLKKGRNTVEIVATDLYHNVGKLTFTVEVK